MAPVNDANRIVTAYTGGDGMYYFFNVAAGQYILKVWDAQNRLIGNYTIVAGNKQYTDIKPIAIP